MQWYNKGCHFKCTKETNDIFQIKECSWGKQKQVPLLESRRSDVNLNSVWHCTFVDGVACFTQSHSSPTTPLHVPAQILGPFLLWTHLTIHIHSYKCNSLAHRSSCKHDCCPPSRLHKVNLSFSLQLGDHLQAYTCEDYLTLYPQCVHKTAHFAYHQWQTRLFGSESPSKSDTGYWVKLTKHIVLVHQLCKQKQEVVGVMTTKDTWVSPPRKQTLTSLWLTHMTTEVNGYGRNGWCCSG